MIAIEVATVDDVDEIMDLCRIYQGESMQDKRKLSEYHFRNTIENSITCDGWTTLKAVDDGVIIGLLIAYENYSFFETPDMDIDFYYIHPDYRGTNASRLLVGCIKSLAIKRGIGILYCGCHSNMPDGGKNNNLFVNLFKKFGFEVTGTNLHLTLGD